MDWTTGEAKAADACIAVMGISSLLEGEEGDVEDFIASVRNNVSESVINEAVRRILRSDFACNSKMVRAAPAA